MALQLPPDESIGFDMTPMIDIVFQLIIFFMLVMDMSQLEVDAVILPTASEAVEDKDPDRDRVIVNICHADVECAAYKGGKICRTDGHWVIKMRGRALSPAALSDEFARAALTMTDAEDPNISNRPIMVRSDGRAPFTQVQKVMREAAKNRIWKVEVGAKQASPD